MNSPRLARIAIVLLVAAAVTAAPIRSALAWGDKAHGLITEEAVARLPDPLRGLFSDQTDLKRLEAASLAADRRADALKAAKSPDYDRERVKHYFDIDGITDEPYPFAHFPHDRKTAEKQFGADKFQEFGAAPWVAEDAFNALVDALSRGATDGIFKSAGDLAHFTADLHTPFHATKNFNGQFTDSKGIHKMFEIGLVNRYLDFYAAEIRKGRTEVPYVENIEDRLFDWLIQANGRVAPILEADRAARKKTGYAPPEKREEFDGEVDDLGSARAKPYYAALKGELESRGSPDAAAMRDAADHLAQLLYTAWVRAGKPLSLSAVASAPAQPEPPVPIWLFVVAGFLILLILWPRRRPAS